MVYNRKYRSSKRRTYNKGYHPYLTASAPAVGLIAAKAAAMVARKYLNSESKFTNGSYSATSVSSSVGTPMAVNYLSQGTDADNRVGRSVRFTSLQSTMTARLHTSATATRFRAVLVLDKYPQGATGEASYNDIYSSLSVNAFRSTTEAKRFKILKDKTFIINTDYPEKSFKHFHKFSYADGKTKFNNANNGDERDIENGLMMWMFLSDESTNTPTISLQSRARFIDN